MEDALGGLADHHVSVIDLANLRTMDARGSVPQTARTSASPTRSAGTHAEWTYAALGQSGPCSRSVRWSDIVPSRVAWTSHPVRNLLASCTVLIILSFATISGILSCIQESSPILQRLDSWRTAESAAREYGLSALHQGSVRPEEANLTQH